MPSDALRNPTLGSVDGMELTETGTDGVTRCNWGNGTAEYAAYHDDEWGRPVDDDQRLFEKLSLEGFQSGLSWITILRKRASFREVFAGFDIERVARFDEEDAHRSLDVVDEMGSFGALVWSFEPPPAPPMHAATTPESVALAKELKRRGFTFVGPTTAYAFMQSMGIVDDHAEACAVRDAVEADRARFVRPNQ